MACSFRRTTSTRSAARWSASWSTVTLRRASGSGQPGSSSAIRSPRSSSSGPRSSPRSGPFRSRYPGEGGSARGSLGPAPVREPPREDLTEAASLLDAETQRDQEVAEQPDRAEDRERHEADDEPTGDDAQP